MKTLFKTIFQTVTILILLFFISQKLLADTHYVNVNNSTPAAPYDTWENAATNIQDAVDAASVDDTVLVTNGVYSSGGRNTPGFILTNRVVITNDITLRSVNGPESTFIVGNSAPGGGQGHGAARCVFMQAGVLDGFTTSNGHTLTIIYPSSPYNETGGGIWLTSGCVITNCTVRGNNTYRTGGGVYCSDGGTLINCTISSNSTTYWNGGGVYCYRGGTLNNCTISDNSSKKDGGGSACYQGGTLNNCKFIGNTAYEDGGGALCEWGGVLKNCTFSGNSARQGGGGAHCYYGGSLSNCTITGNSAMSRGGGVRFYRGGVLNDCTISGNSSQDSAGGAICWQGGVLNNCKINGNTSEDDGGGAFCDEGGILNNCTISGNSAEWEGGGVSCFKGGALSNCKINGNSADEEGGGVEFFRGGVLSNCTINGNNATLDGGGAYFYEGGTLINCTINSNTTELDGGGVTFYNSGTLNNCSVSENSSKRDGGGAFCNYGGTLNNCKISGNTADAHGGGALCLFGGALTNCLITGLNSAEYGGGAECWDGGVLWNCTIGSNNANFYGGGVFCTNDASLINCIVYHNSALQGGDNWYSYGTGVTFNYSCTFPTNNLPGGYQCIPDDPMFQDPGSDYHLKAISPCINHGTNADWMIGETDLDGKPRIIPTGGTVDMGAYEAGGAPTIYVTPSILDFGFVVVLDESVEQVSVRNLGGGIVTGEVYGVTAPFSYAANSPTSYFLGYLETTNIMFKFVPTEMGRTNIVVEFTGSGGTNAVLTGVGIPEPGIIMIMLLVVISALKRFICPVRAGRH